MEAEAQAMGFKKFIPPMSIVVFLVLTAAGAYRVRLGIMEKHMVAAIGMQDKRAIVELANCFPSPVNARYNDGCTALHWAAERGDRALVELLLRKGADIDARTFGPILIGPNSYIGGQTPLHKAAEAGRIEAAEILIAWGADLNAKDCMGRKPLIVAVSKTQKGVIELLIAKGADINGRDDHGWAPIHWAAHGNKEVMELLIAKGADVNAKVNFGHRDWTALQLAIDFGRMDVAEVLRKAGAKEDRSGNDEPEGQ
jgi:ankyrin repeat protein